jgi:hypothetical protein
LILTHTFVFLIKILEFDNDLDSDSDTERNLSSHHKSKSQSDNQSLSQGNQFSLNTNTSDRFKTSINNCAAWLQTSVPSPSTLSKSEEESSLSAAPATSINDTTNKKATNTLKPMNLPDLSQPPPPLLSNYVNLAHLAAQPPPPPPLPPPPPPPPLPPQSNKQEHELKNESTKESKRSHESKHSQKEKERERSKRGLPHIRASHLCICSKTLWLGHLAKSTSDTYLNKELADIVAAIHSESDRKSSSSSKKSSSSKNKENAIIDVHVRIIDWKI